MKSFRIHLSIFLFAGLLLIGSWSMAQECPSLHRGLALKTPSLARAMNPNPSSSDLILPLPCGAELALRHVCVPSSGYFEDMPAELGCQECQRPDMGYMDGKRLTSVSGVFVLRDLPETWQKILSEQATKGDGRCPSPDDDTAVGFYYFISKYEITNYQWRVVMGDGHACDGIKMTSEDPRPKTGLNWYEAVEFTKRLTEWLLKKHPRALPWFSNGRPAFIRLPTENEWEYAARGGHRVTEMHMNQDDFFPLHGRKPGDFAVFTEMGASSPPQNLAWIGSKCANPIGLYDTAGNAAEMTMDPFRFTVGYRSHGAAGGMVIKGGSFLRSLEEVFPGRREEAPLFIKQGPYSRRDLGFRVVLSTILTPAEREESLKRQWIDFGRKAHLTSHPQKSFELDVTKNPIDEIDKFLNENPRPTERKNLEFLRNVIKKNNITIQKQKAQSVRGVIKSAILTASFAENFALSRRRALNEIMSMERKAQKAGSKSSRQNWIGLIEMQKENILLLEEAIEESILTYISKMKECRSYNAQLIEEQIARLTDELSAGGPFSQHLLPRLALFQKHVTQVHQNKTGKIDKGGIITDIIPENLIPD